MAEGSCPHPYFGPTEDILGLALMGMWLMLVVAGFVIVVGALSWLVVRWRTSIIILASGVLMLAVVYFGGRLFLRHFDAAYVFRWQLGTDELARLQRELQTREADLERYGREHPDWSNEQIVKGFIATNTLPKRFYFSDPEIPPLVFLISDWRDTVPRVVIHFGCSNNMVFDSKTMALQQID